MLMTASSLKNRGKWPDKSRRKGGREICAVRCSEPTARQEWEERERSQALYRSWTLEQTDVDVVAVSFWWKVLHCSFFF